MKNSAIQDIDHKIDIMDHVNQDHPEELLAIARSHEPNKAILSASIEDIYQEGLKINITFATEQDKAQAVIPFEIEGSLEDKILYLAYASIVKQGLDFSGTGKQFFEVIKKQNITENIIRLTVKSDMPLPEYYPGYTYAFVLKGMKKRPTEVNNKAAKKSWGKRIFDRIFILLMKHLSKNNREKLLYSANKNVRLYTLRKSWKSSITAKFPDRGYVDIYTHNNTPGSQWAEQLSIGDIIMSRSETKDKHPHLATGQALLIADETAYPALAGILEHWQNPTPPQVIVISSKKAEQCYFTEQDLPTGSEIHRVICAEVDQADAVLPVLAEIENIEVVWAALESSAAKKVRHYLRNERQIQGRNNHTKAYWNLKPKHLKVKEG